MKVKGEKFMKEELVFISLPLMFVLFLNENNFKKQGRDTPESRRSEGKRQGKKAS